MMLCFRFSVISSTRWEKSARFWLENLKETDKMERLPDTWEDNFNMELKEIGCQSVGFTYLVQQKFQWPVSISKKD
jgi:hypothetical protein